MGKFILFPLEGGTTTKAVIGAVTLSASGGITAIGGAGVVAGAGYTFPPIVTVTSTDGQGSGAVIISRTLAAGVPTFDIISAGSGYTSAAAVICTVSAQPFYLNADAVLSIVPVAAGTSTALNTTLVIKLNAAATPTLTLTFANPLNAAAPFASGVDPIATKNAITNAIMASTNVKDVSQLTPVTFPNGCLLVSAVYA